MCKNWVILTLILLLFFCGLSSVSASTPAKIVTGFVTNVVSALVKWLWSLKSTSTTKTGLIANGFNLGALSSRSMIKFDNGYTVETVFDGSKLGIEPYSVELSPTGELLVLDSENSNIYKISIPLSRYSRPKLVAGSPEGYSGHVDGKLRETRMNHPKGLTVDDRGNIYIADPINMAIRKISDTGVTTIAGGKWSRGGGHIDGPSEDAKFSTDFDVIYVGSSCSLLVIDRGNQAIREIRLQPDDCFDQYDSSFHLGLAVLVGAVFFGYMLALLQLRIRALFSSSDDSRTPVRRGVPMPPYQQPQKSVRPPLIPQEDETEKIDEEGFFGSIGRLVMNTASSMAEIFGGLFSGSRKNPVSYKYQHQYPNMHMNAWERQESYVPKKSYPFMMTQDTVEKNHHHHNKQTRPYYSSWDGGDYQQQSTKHNHQQQHHLHYSSDPKTFYETSCDCETNEIVFGAVQEEDRRHEAVVIKAVDYADPRYNIRPRINYVSDNPHGHRY